MQQQEVPYSLATRRSSCRTLQLPLPKCSRSVMHTTQENGIFQHILKKNNPAVYVREFQVLAVNPNSSQGHDLFSNIFNLSTDPIPSMKVGFCLNSNKGLCVFVCLVLFSSCRWR